MVRPLRPILIIVGLALTEVTAPALLLDIWGGAELWAVLLTTALGCAGAEWLSGRLLGERWHGPAVALAALGVGLWVAQAAARAPDLGTALLGPASFAGYAGLLVGLYAAWRGARLTSYAQTGLAALLRRDAAVSLVALLALSAAGMGPGGAALATAQVVGGVAAGLVTAALVRAEELGDGGERLGWRGGAPIGAAVGLVLLLGVGLLALLSGEARRALLAAGGALGFLVAALLLPIVIAVMPAMEWLLRALHATELLAALHEWAAHLPQQSSPPIDFLDEITRTLPWLRPLLGWLARLAPIALLLLAVWLAVRRRRPPSQGDEERVSLFSWHALADDMRGLLGMFGRPRPAGLHDVLAQLAGDSPDLRVRRAYVRLLIALEERGAARPEPATPREFLPDVERALPGTPAALAALTERYERARYQPGAITPADAEVAERALGEATSR
jgi:hypothetical protein